MTRPRTRLPQFTGTERLPGGRHTFSLDNGHIPFTLKLPENAGNGPIGNSRNTRDGPYGRQDRQAPAHRFVNKPHAQSTDNTMKITIH